MSTSDDKIIFYNATVCPYAQRAAIALKEVGAEYEEVLIDLKNKPEWYKDINPETKVPALTVEGQNIAESLVLIEYIADRFPEANLLPKEPIKRANIRFAIEYYSSKITAGFFKVAFNLHGEGARETYEKEVNAAYVRFAELLTQQSATGPYFLGEKYSLADVALTPFIQRIEVFHKEFLDDFQFEAVKNSTRLQEYFQGLLSRPSAQATWVGDDNFAKGLAERTGLTRK